MLIACASAASTRKPKTLGEKVDRLQIKICTAVGEEEGQSAQSKGEGWLECGTDLFFLQSHCRFLQSSARKNLQSDCRFYNQIVEKIIEQNVQNLEHIS